MSPSLSMSPAKAPPLAVMGGSVQPVSSGYKKPPSGVLVHEFYPEKAGVILVHGRALILLA